MVLILTTGIVVVSANPHLKTAPTKTFDGGSNKGFRRRWPQTIFSENKYSSLGGNWWVGRGSVSYIYVWNAEEDTLTCL